MIEIPINSSNDNIRLSVFLSEIKYTLDVVYNKTTGRYTLSVLDINNVVLLAGITMVINLDLIENYRSFGLPDGRLFITSSKNRDPELGDFDGIASLFYDEN